MDIYESNTKPDIVDVKCSLFRYDLWELVTNVVSASEPFVKVLRIINGGKPPMGYIL